jgi:hypothetical protein
VGYTIATVEVEPYEEDGPAATDAESDADAGPERRV